MIRPAAGGDPNIIFYGGDGEDTLHNYNDPEYFEGEPGPDKSLVAAGKGGGEDILNGGPGVDTLFGGPGNDRLNGDSGSDELHGDGGDDTIFGGLDGDTAFGGSGKDAISGGPGRDQLNGDDDDDTIRGDEDCDVIRGGNGDDVIDTGPSGPILVYDDDEPTGGEFSEIAYGQDGNDVIWATKAGGATYLSGGNQNDRIYGSAFEDRIDAGDGHDVVEAALGNDTVDGGDKSDRLWGGGDQPWRDNGVGNPTWFNMDASGPDNDGDCDIEDDHFDWDGDPCIGGPLIAADDSFSVSHSSLILHSLPGAPNVRANDTSTQSSVIQVTQQPLHGTLSMYNDGTFTYIPNGTFVGTDDFYYQLVDYVLTSPWPARVVINVTNAAPVASPDGPIYLSEGTPKMFNILTGAGSPNPIADFDADGDDIDIDLNSIVGPEMGTLLIDDETGEVTYTYTGPDLVPGTYMPDSFTYKAKDDWDSSIEAKTVQLMITGVPLMLDLPPVEPSPDTRSITEADLALLADEAARRWVLAGVDPVTAQRALEGTKFVVDDLPGSILGLEFPGTIVIDVNAAGYGWFVDATPSLDEEFDIVISASERQAGKRSPAFGRVDLLTALEHELGHALGMDHPDGDEFAHSVMHETLLLSTRRIPTAADILAADEYYASLGDGGSLLRRRW